MTGRDNGDAAYRREAREAAEHEERKADRRLGQRLRRFRENWRSLSERNRAE